MPDDNDKKPDKPEFVQGEIGFVQQEIDRLKKIKSENELVGNPITMNFPKNQDDNKSKTVPKAGPINLKNSSDENVDLDKKYDEEEAEQNASHLRLKKASNSSLDPADAASPSLTVTADSEDSASPSLTVTADSDSPNKKPHITVSADSDPEAQKKADEEKKKDENDKKKDAKPGDNSGKPGGFYLKTVAVDYGSFAAAIDFLFKALKGLPKIPGSIYYAAKNVITRQSWFEMRRDNNLLKAEQKKLGPLQKKMADGEKFLKDHQEKISGWEKTLKEKEELPNTPALTKEIAALMSNIKTAKEQVPKLSKEIVELGHDLKKQEALIEAAEKTVSANKDVKEAQKAKYQGNIASGIFDQNNEQERAKSKNFEAAGSNAVANQPGLLKSLAEAREAFKQLLKTPSSAFAEKPKVPAAPITSAFNNANAGSPSLINSAANPAPANNGVVAPIPVVADPNALPDVVPVAPPINPRRNP